MSWWWRRKETNGHENRRAAVARSTTEAKLAVAKKATKMVEQLADQVAQLPAEEFADRVARAFVRRAWTP